MPKSRPEPPVSGQKKLTPGIKGIVGHRIRQERLRRNMTQMELAEIAGMSDRYLAMVELGRGNISVEKLARIADVLEMEAFELLIPPKIS